MKEERERRERKERKERKERRDGRTPPTKASLGVVEEPFVMGLGGGGVDGAGGDGDAVVKPIDVGAEYAELTDAIHGRGRFGDMPAGDVYQELMKKERRVLDTVDRVVNDSRAKESVAFLNLPLHVIAIRMVAAVKGLLDDLMEARSYKDVARALLQPDRRTYLGMCVIALALIIMAVDTATA